MEADDNQKRSEELAQEGHLQSGGQPGGQGGADETGADEPGQGLCVQIAVFPVSRQGQQGGGEEVEQVDALGRSLVHA